MLPPLMEVKSKYFLAYQVGQVKLGDKVSCLVISPFRT
jgi:hypothetical protein